MLRAQVHHHRRRRTLFSTGRYADEIRLGDVVLINRHVLRRLADGGTQVTHTLAFGRGGSAGAGYQNGARISED